MLEFPNLLRMLRRVGPNVELISRLVGESEADIINLLNSVKNLSFSPVPANKFLKVTFHRDINGGIYSRVNLKGNFSILFSKRGASVVKFENFSGIPEAYDVMMDTWRLDYEGRSEPQVYEFSYEGEVEPIDASAFSTTSSMNDILKSSLNLGTIQGFVVDYGRRDFILDVITPYEEIKESLQYLPFLRYVMWIKDESIIYLAELSIPEAHVKEVMEVIYEIKNHAHLLFSTTAKDFTRPII
ncbi:hypothetical protein GWK48_08530 [Metallosphaera tengchongensis]|uniref:Uncharacterized protein n=1 Tax=Metallosphaera tengchongensis TaxID=1532350 RepID=A0A6N0NZ46_9CREN|nr:hypothetical protein [Metallosphaera tengchongensis]QKR00411.1 hypothetical protein GWK48_08530 [Metallosphaera tengchongensis]